MKQLLNAGRGHRAPRKAANSLWKEVGKNITDKKRGKRVRDRDPSWGSSCEGGEVSKQLETLSLVGLWGVWNFRGQHNRERGKKKTNHKIGAFHNSQWRTIPDACFWHQQAGTGQGGAGYILRVRTGPECPEDNLRELT